MHVVALKLRIVSGSQRPPSDGTASVVKDTEKSANAACGRPDMKQSDNSIMSASIGSTVVNTADCGISTLRPVLQPWGEASI